MDGGISSPERGPYRATLSLLIGLAALLSACGGSGTNRAGPVSGVLSVSAPEQVETGSTFSLGLDESGDLNRICRECLGLEFPVVTTTGDELGRVRPGESFETSFDTPGLWVVMPRSSPDLETPFSTGLADATVIPAGPSGDFEQVPARIILRSVNWVEDEGRVDVLLDLTNGHLTTPDEFRFGFVDPSFHQVRINIVALDENGNRVYDGEAVTVDVETTRPLLIRHEPPEDREFDSLVLNVGATRLVPGSRFFIKPKSIDLPLEGLTD